MSEQVGEAVIRVRTDETDVDTEGAGKRAGKGYSSGFSKSVKGLAGVIGGAIAVDKVIGFAKDSIAEGRESIKVQALTTQILKTTAGAAHVTSAEIGNLANTISAKTGIDDEQVQSSENVLLRYKLIANQVGKNNDIFNRATQVSIDLAASQAAATGGQINLAASSKIVGRALQDPVKGVTALTKAGVILSDQQKATIKALVQGGDANAAIALKLVGSTTAYNAVLKENKGNATATAKALTQGLNPAQKQLFDHLSEGNHFLEAQKTLLGQLNGVVGGTAAKTATAGDKMGVAFKNIEESIGLALLPELDKFETFVTNKAAPAVQEFIKGMQDGTGAGGDLAHVLETIGGDLKNTAQFLIDHRKFVEAAAGAWVAWQVAAIAYNVTQLISLARTRLLTVAVSENAIASKAAAVAANNLGTAGRVAGGAAGLSLLVAGAQESNKSIGQLTDTIGGATAGFAVGGPWGAGIGAVGGAIFGLVQIIKEGGQTEKEFLAQNRSVYKSLQPARAAWQGYGDDINKATGALKRNAVQTALTNLETSGQLNLVRQLGIPVREFINASLGQEAALKAVRTALNGQEDGSLGASLAAKQLNDFIDINIGLTDDAKLKQQDYNEALHDTPKTAKTTVSVPGLTAANLGFDGLIRRANQINGKHIKATVEIAGKTIGLDLLGGLPHLASGTQSFGGGDALVGENGPEIVTLPARSAVTPAPQTQRILQGGFNVQTMIVQPHNYNEFNRELQRRSALASIGGRPVGVQ